MFGYQRPPQPAAKNVYDTASIYGQLLAVYSANRLCLVEWTSVHAKTHQSTIRHPRIHSVTLPMREITGSRTMASALLYIPSRRFVLGHLFDPLACLGLPFRLVAVVPYGLTRTRLEIRRGPDQRLAFTHRRCVCETLAKMPGYMVCCLLQKSSTCCEFLESFARHSLVSAHRDCFHCESLLS